MYAAIEHGRIVAICHTAENAWLALEYFGDFRDTRDHADKVCAAFPTNPANLDLLARFRDTLFRRAGFAVTRVTRDFDGGWRATNY